MTRLSTLKHFYCRFKHERAIFINAFQSISSETNLTEHVTHLLNQLMFHCFMLHSRGEPLWSPCCCHLSSWSTLTNIHIPDKALTRLFAFFDEYQWRLDEQQTKDENVLHPDVLGYVFEQRIDQKQMGAYYTNEDVTTYIANNTIISYLFDAVKAKHPSAFLPDHAIWQLLRTDPDRYIRNSVRCTAYLPTETEREYRTRRVRYNQLYVELQEGKVCTTADLITYNLDIQRFAQDVIARCEQPDLLLAFYTTLEQMTILDPTCGAGAFLIAAMNTLEPLYTACLDRMHIFVNKHNDTDANQYINAFRVLLNHAPLNQRHFILTSIITHNLYGVDIMEEAVEVCKMQLLLILLAQDERLEDVASLSPIQWNIRAGNALEASMWVAEFPGIMARGGFDVLIGNPPYVEYSKVRHSYTESVSETESHGNLYAAFVQRSLTLCRSGESYLGLVVPLSMCSSERFEQLRATIIGNTSALWLSNFEIFPCRLFDGAFQRLTILLGKHGTSPGHGMQVTRIQRWYAAERPHLIDLITYTSTQHLAKPGVFPKLASSLQTTILQKVLKRSEGGSIAAMLSAYKTEHSVYYQEATNNWMKATRRIPFHKKNDVVTRPPHGRLMYFRDDISACIIMALMNSSLFYLWFSTYSDGFHLSHALVKDFPVSKELYASEELLQLATRLEEDILRHAIRSTRNTRAGDNIEIEEYRIVYSKPIIDEIDGTLAGYYGFTDEELDFLINYDIKYRMGKDSNK